MRVRLEQVFYGRGENGYAVLGASPGGRSLARRVEALCGAAGTPGGNYGGEPFLLSVPDGDWVVMLRGRRGKPDSMGRTTLFYHALAGLRTELASAHADAFALDAQGVFAERMPDGEVGVLEVEVRPWMESPPAWTGKTPCLIRSDKPEPEAVRSAVGEHANDWAWADFAFQAMDGFVVQVLPPRTDGVRGVAEYDGTGRLLRAGRPQTGREGDTAGGTGNAHMPNRGKHGMDTGGGRADEGAKKTCPQAKKRDRKYLFASLAANVALLLACVALLARGGTAPTAVDDPVIQSDEIRNEAVSRYRSKLAESFPADARITDFLTAKRSLPKVESIETDDKYKEAKDFLRRTQAYVDFVESRIFDNKTNPENDRP
jgi:hypothetical protein